MPWLTMAWTWLLRLVGGWLPLGNKPIGEWLGKILWAVGIVAACLFVYNKLTAPTTNTRQVIQKGGYGTITNNQPKVYFGCANFRLDPNANKEVK